MGDEVIVQFKCKIILTQKIARKHMASMLDPSQYFLGVVECLDQVEDKPYWEDLADNEYHHQCIYARHVVIRE